MDNHLFSKYQKVIQIDADKKQVVIDLIEKASGVRLAKEEVALKKNEVSLHVSSAKKSKFHQANIKALLGESGYILRY